MRLNRRIPPELQDPDVFADSMENIVATHRHVAENYFADHSIELACPPLRALLHFMRDGQWNEQSLDGAEFRALFTREHLLSSDWYEARWDVSRPSRSPSGDSSPCTLWLPYGVPASAGPRWPRPAG